MAKQLEMLTDVSGTRDRAPWPAHGGITGSLPDAEADAMIAAGIAIEHQP